MSEDWIKKWYNESFSESNVYPQKSDNWEKIERKTKDWAKFWYTSNAKDFSASPKEGSWETISSQLDIQSDNNKASRNSLWLNVAASILILVIPYVLVDDQMPRQIESIHSSDFTLSNVIST